MYWVSKIFAFLKTVAISNNPVKNKPSTVKFPIQINGLSNHFMSALVQCVSLHVS